MNNKIKIAILTECWLSKKGGITTRFYSLTKLIQETDEFDLVVITSDTRKGKNIVNVSSSSKILLFITTLYALIRFCPKIIHCVEHGYSLLASVIYKKVFNHKTKILFSIHTDRGIKKQKKLYNILWIWAVNKCDCFLSVSRYLTEEITRLRCGIILIPIRILPTQVGIKYFEQMELKEFKKRFNLEGCAPVICTIGVFEFDWKITGIEILIESFKKLNFCNGRLLIVGDGKYRKYLEDVSIKSGLQSKIIFTGYLDNPFLALEICDIYCHLALREALGIAILEAMIMGKPVIAANRGGIPEIVKDKETGLLVEPDTDDVGKAIELLLRDSHLRNTIAKNAKIFVERQHNPKVVIKEYKEILLQIIREG